MFNPLTRIRHRCPFCGTTPFIFEWEGRYMYYCAGHLNGPYADTREEAWISGAERLRTFGKGTGNDLDHTKFWKAVAENRSENAVVALETMIEETE